MCTVTWLAAADQLDLLFNRDEQRARASGRPPRLGKRNGLSYAAPVDAAAGGSWIAANESGLIVCLLNHYGAAAGAASGKVSRGRLVLAGMAFRTPAELEEWLTPSRARRYAPFIFLALHPDEPGRTWQWDGRTLTRPILPHPMEPITTSSYRSEEVVRQRVRHYHAMRAAAPEAGLDLLLRYHAGEPEPETPFSVCMARSDACTVSLTHVRVGRDRVEVRYRPGPPCRSASWTTLALPRLPTR